MSLLPCLRKVVLPAAAALTFVSAIPTAQAQSEARLWNDVLLEAIRNDFARPTVHARNLYHVSIAMWDAWAVYDFNAQPILTDEDHATLHPLIDQWRSETLSYATYRILNSRFANSPGAATMLPQFTQLMNTLGYDPNYQSTVGDTPADIGNRIAVNVLAFGLGDNANEQGGYANQYYFPVNPPLLPAFPGNPTIVDPNRWQPLALEFFINQSGNPIPGGFPEFLGPEWGIVKPFALSLNDLTVYNRGDGFDYWVYHDPGPPPYVGTSSEDDYKKGFEMVAVWSAQLDAADGVMIDISPGVIGNSPLPTTDDYDTYYDFFNGGDSGTGHAINPSTSVAYPPNVVPRGDYGRVLAEFWADGPDSETPPGHWFTILNKVSDDPQFVKQLQGRGPILNDLEWDVKAYITMGGAMHDCAVTAWGIKGWYDYIRPVSALRYLADQGQASDPGQPSYNPAGIRLYPGYIEVVTAATTATGQKHEHLAGEEGKIAIFAWRGPDYITNPDTDVAGCDWILAENWWPYQRPSFVTPPFAGYVSGHSTYSRAAAVVMDRITGDPFFPGGVGEFFCPQNSFLVFEDGPSQNITLQWATYYDASDQTSLSRIWGGIHPPADDIPGRIMGEQIGADAVDLALEYFGGTACDSDGEITLYGEGCPGEADYVPQLTIDGCPTPGGTITTRITNAQAGNAALLVVGIFEADLPLIGTCSLYVTPFLLSVVLPLNGDLGTPGSGGITVSAALPASFPTNSLLKLQAICGDSTLTWGYTSSHGVSLLVK